MKTMKGGLFMFFLHLHVIFINDWALYRGRRMMQPCYTMYYFDCYQPVNNTELQMSLKT